MTEAPQSGIPGFDRLLDGLRVGDNIVWVAPRDLWTSLLGPFIKGASGRGLCYVAVDSPADDVLRRFRPHLKATKHILVDCHAGAPASRSTTPEQPEAGDLVAGDPRDLDAIQVLMKGLEDELGPGIGYVFESLTGMQQLWGADGALSFFLTHCPRLYELDTVAYWFLDPSEHEKGFLQRVQQVTQVVLEVLASDEPIVRVVKADARPPEVVGRIAKLQRHPNRSVTLAQEPSFDHRSGGELLKRRRMERGMSQAELARRLGITPSALSQAEHGRRGLSAETMKLAWRELGLGQDGDGPEQAAPTYVLARRGARALTSLAPGLQGEKVIEQPSGLEAYLMTLAPGASGRRPPVPTKRPEFVLVTEGVLQLRIGEAKEVLHAGDAIFIGTQPLNGWRNPSPTVTRAMWVVLP